VVPGPDSGACQLENDNLMRLGSVWYNIAKAGWVHWGWIMPRIRIATTALTSAAASESEGDELRVECYDQCQCQLATVYRLTVRVYRLVSTGASGTLSGVVIKG